MKNIFDAVESVVQIHADGFDETDVQSILDPRIKIPSSWVGSGFFIKDDEQRVFILTNAHVARNAKKIRITTLLTSEDFFKVELVGLNPEGFPDVAALRLPQEEERRLIKKIGRQPHLQMGDSESVKRGEPIKAIGYPFGMAEPNVSGGEITNFLPGDNFYPERLVTDAAINPGNSGGPAISSNKKAIGINTAIVVGADNISFVIPINTIKTVFSKIDQNSSLEFSDLGARFQAGAPSTVNYLGFSEKDGGVIVKQIMPNGTLARAGLQKNDLLFKIENFAFDSYGVTYAHNPYRKKNILDIVRSLPLNTEVGIEFGRKGERYQVKTKLLATPCFGIFSQPIVQKRRYINLAGLIIQEMTYEIISALSYVLNRNYWREVHANEYSENKVLVITHIDPDSAGEKLHLPVGEILKTVNQKSVYSLEDMLEVAKGSSHKDLVLEFENGSLGVILSSEIDSPIEINPDNCEKQQSIFKIK